MNSDTSVKNILILAANPKGTAPVNINKESRGIKEGLRRSRMRDYFKVYENYAVRPEDVQRTIYDYKPNIIHFSGHGKGEEGLVFDSETGEPQMVSGDALAGIFEEFADQIECVVLNGCYSEVQAKEIAKHINYVIGMNKAIGDEAAIKFAVGFYEALGGGRSIDSAFRLGCNAIQIQNIQEHLTPQLFKNPNKRKFPRLWPLYLRRSLINVLLKSSIPITSAIIILRFIGVFEASELWLYDQMMMRKLTIEEQDKRLLIIEVTRQDIENQTGFRRGSLTNETLLSILEKLLGLKNKPKTIGIDIYRNFATDKNTDANKKLANILETESSIFAVCNVGRPGGKDGVTPPPEFPLERLGFSDFILDNGGIIRRQLLSMEGHPQTPCKYKEGSIVENSFSLQLALHYLGKPYQKPSKENNQTAKIGNTVFTLLDGQYQGGYYNPDFGGEQILLNYSILCKSNCSLEIAEKVTVTDVIKNDVLKNYKDLKNRIVLIGVTDPSYENPWSTPFSFPYEQVPGVILQAQMVSQILDAVSGERHLLKVWSFWYEMLWIFAWSLMGGALFQWFLFKKSLVIIGGLVFIILPISSLIMFNSVTPTWVPLSPPALSFTVTGGVVVFLKLRNRNY